MNFLALVVISEFDDFFFSTVLGEPMATLISDGEVELVERQNERDQKITIELEELLKTTVTSSDKAKMDLDRNKFKEIKPKDKIYDHDEATIYERQPLHFYIDFTDDRTCGGKTARLLYIFLRWFFASIWFYFIPFSCLYLAYAIPFVYTDSEASRN